MQFKDYYKIIGVGDDASQDAIKSAYRKRAAKLHPDVNKAADAQKRFTDLGEAYEVLGDAAKRRDYDALRRQGWREGQELDRAAPVPPYGGYPGGGDDGDQFSDFFQSFFGGPRGHGRRSRPMRGEDIHHPITVTLDEVYQGGKRQLRMTLPGGGGNGRLLDVTIPKGIQTGETMRLRGQGMPGDAGGEAGDLYLDVAIAPHPRYRVDKRDILIDLPLAPWEAVLGANVEAATLGGVAQVTIPAGAQDGQRLRLKGRGLPGKPPGDQYLVLRIAVPPTASTREQELWRELAAASHFDPRATLAP